MEYKSGIYMIESPTNRIYIGQSKNVVKRWNGYLNLNSTNKTVIRLYRSLKKHGVHNHIFTAIEWCDVSELNNRERYWQDYYDVTGKNGLNCVLVKSNDKPSIVSEETRLKMSVSAKAKVLTPEHKKKLKDAAILRKGTKGRKRTKEECKALSERNIRLGAFKGKNNPFYKNGRFGKTNPFYGKKHTDSSKELMRMSSIGKVASLETKALLSKQRSMGNNSSAKIVCNMENGIFYSCGKEAWLSTSKYSYSTFRSKLNGSNKYPTSYRYV